MKITASKYPIDSKTYKAMIFAGKNRKIEGYNGNKI